MIKKTLLALALLFQLTAIATVASAEADYPACYPCDEK